MRIIVYSKSFKIASAVVIFLFVFFTSIEFTLNFKGLYYFDINYLNIEKSLDLDKEEIKSSYTYIINYINTPAKMEFNLPNLPSSTEGKIHFQEVKTLVFILNIVFLASFVITLISLYIFYKIKDFSILNIVSNIWISLSILLITLFSINFNIFFTFFHNFVFNNNYWLFDPEKDPIIKILPENFFMHCTILIFALIIFISLLLKIIFHKITLSKLMKNS